MSSYTKGMRTEKNQEIKIFLVQCLKALLIILDDCGFSRDIDISIWETEAPNVEMFCHDFNGGGVCLHSRAHPSSLWYQTTFFPSHRTTGEVHGGTLNLQTYSKALQFIKWKEPFVGPSVHVEASGMSYPLLGLNEISVLL